VQQVADLVGDSLGLSAKAAATEARMIVFAGVHFMAESAKILSPGKKVVMPRADAGCPLADTITVEKLRALQAEHPGAPTVCYINTTAAIKAEVDICCTSANMQQVVESLLDKKVLFVPDGNMGRYLQTKLPDRELILWKGVCPTHHRLRAEHVLEQRACTRRRSSWRTRSAVSRCWSSRTRCARTTGFLRYAKESDATEFIVGTETGIIPRLEAENPAKRFYRARGDGLPNMKMTNLEDVLAVLEKEDNEILVPDEIRVRAVRSLERMLKSREGLAAKFHRG